MLTYPSYYLSITLQERIARACAQPIVPTLDVIRMYTHIVLTESDQVSTSVMILSICLQPI